jgi:hypothetical protein
MAELSNECERASAVGTETSGANVEGKKCPVFKTPHADDHSWAESQAAGHRSPEDHRAVPRRPSALAGLDIVV